LEEYFMPNIGTLLKEEIRRLAKKEIRTATASLRKDNARLKRTAAEHKRRLAVLERANRTLTRDAEVKLKEAPTAAAAEVEKARFGSRAVRALRKRLKLSQADFAKLLGVSSGAVFLWEKEDGPLSLKVRTKAALVGARKLGVREANRRLGALAAKAPAKKTKKRKKSKKPARRGGRKRRRT
jgi:DNA-binding transcriptional regulator YiaG